jgi:hypothetical protein
MKGDKAGETDEVQGKFGEDEEEVNKVRLELIGGKWHLQARGVATGKKWGDARTIEGLSVEVCENRKEIGTRLECSDKIFRPHFLFVRWRY